MRSGAKKWSGLCAAQPSIEIVVAPTPEIDALIAMMRDGVSAEAEEPSSYLGPGIDAAAVASFFGAAAQLFRAAPWKVVPSDDALFAVTIESLGLRDAALSVIGQLGEHRGLVLFDDLDDFEAFVDASDAFEDGEEPELPPHVALTFVRGAELDDAMRKEIATHGWEVAHSSAYPELVIVAEGTLGRRHTATDLGTLEAIARALVELIGERKLLAKAWTGGDALARTLTVQTHAGALEVSVRTPYPRPTIAAGTDIVARMEALVDIEPIDEREIRRLEDELVDVFAASPEAQQLRHDVGACRILLDFTGYFGATIATMRAHELLQLVFELIPQKVGIGSREARPLIEELRAFYAFMKRAYALAQADACLRVLAGDAATRLEVALVDASNFGMAKSLMMAGREAGFPIDTPGGLAAWMHELQSQPLPASVRLPGSSKSTRGDEATRAKKDKRKQARTSRKKNR